MEAAAVQVPVAGEYRAAEARWPWASWPPTTSTWRLGRNVAVWPEREAGMGEAVGVQAPVAAAYTSALDSGPEGPVPPVTSTLPSGSRVAVWPKRAVGMGPVDARAPIEAS